MRAQIIIQLICIFSDGFREQHSFWPMVQVEAWWTKHIWFKSRIFLEFKWCCAICFSRGLVWQGVCYLTISLLLLCTNCVVLMTRYWISNHFNCRCIGRQNKKLDIQWITELLSRRFFFSYSDLSSTTERRPSMPCMTYWFWTREGVKPWAIWWIVIANCPST